MLGSQGLFAAPKGAVRINGIQVVESEGVVQLVVSTSGKVKPRLESAAGKTIVKISGSKLAKEQNIEVGKGPILRIRPGQHGKESWIVVDLSENVKPDLSVVDSGFSLSYRSDSAKGPSAAPAPENAGDSLEAKAVPLVSAGLTYRVVDIFLQGEGEKTQVVISADGPVRFKHARLDNGKTISLTMLNCSLAWSPSGKGLSNEAIDKVTAKQGQQDGQSTVKVDIVLTEPLAFSVAKDQNQIVISVDLPESKEEDVKGRGNLDTIVSLDVQNADLVGTLKSLSQQAGFETYFTLGIMSLAAPLSLVTIHYEKQTFQTVISRLTGNAGMYYDLQGNLLIFGTMTEINAQKANLPRETKYFAPHSLDAATFLKKLNDEIAVVDPVLASAISLKMAFVQLDDDPSTDAILLGGTKSDLAKLLAIASRVDRPNKNEAGVEGQGGATAAAEEEEADEPSGGGRKTQVFYMKYLDPSTAALQDKITQIMTPPNGAMQGNFTFDTRTRSYIVTAPTKYLKKVRQLLDKLDIAVPQVQIEGRIVEVAVSDIKSLGINWTANSAQANPDPNIIANVSAPVLPIGTLQVTTLQNNFHINATISALETQNKANTLSSPKISTQDGNMASIQTQDTYQYRVDTTVYNSAGQPSVTSTWASIVVPITLQVTPSVNEDTGEIRMAVTFNVTSVTSQPAADQPPGTSQQTASTLIRVKNGETVVIGGLMRDHLTNIENKVPILGDIPLLGSLFKSKTVNQTKDELIILLTPTILEN